MCQDVIFLMWSMHRCQSCQPQIAFWLLFLSAPYLALCMKQQLGSKLIPLRSFFHAIWLLQHVREGDFGACFLCWPLAVPFHHDSIGNAHFCLVGVVSSTLCDHGVWLSSRPGTTKVQARGAKKHQHGIWERRFNRFLLCLQVGHTEYLVPNKGV